MQINHLLHPTPSCQLHVQMLRSLVRIVKLQVLHVISSVPSVSTMKNVSKTHQPDLAINVNVEMNSVNDSVQNNVSKVNVVKIRLNHGVTVIKDGSVTIVNTKTIRVDFTNVKMVENVFSSMINLFVNVSKVVSIMVIVVNMNMTNW